MGGIHLAKESDLQNLDFLYDLTGFIIHHMNLPNKWMKPKGEDNFAQASVLIKFDRNKCKNGDNQK